MNQLLTNDQSHKTMNDIMMSMVFILMMVLLKSVVLPENIKVNEEQPLKEQEWLHLHMTEMNTPVTINKKIYPNVTHALSSLPESAFLKINIANIKSAKDTFSLMQIIQTIGMQNVYFVNNKGE